MSTAKFLHELQYKRHKIKDVVLEQTKLLQFYITLCLMHVSSTVEVFLWCDVNKSVSV